MARTPASRAVGEDALSFIAVRKSMGGKGAPARDTSSMIVDCAVYEDGRRRAGELPLEDACEAARPRGRFVWIGLHEPTEDEFDSVRREFDLHELAVEDAIKAHQRPKLEVYGDSLFVVLKTARYLEAEDDRRVRRDPALRRRRLHHHRPPRRDRPPRRPPADRAAAGPAALRARRGALRDRRPGRRRLRAGDRRRSTATSSEVEREVFSPVAQQPGRAHLQAEARGARAARRASLRSLEPLDRLARGTTSSIHEEIRAVLPRRARPPAARRRRRSRASAIC